MIGPVDFALEPPRFHLSFVALDQIEPDPAQIDLVLVDFDLASPRLNQAGLVAGSVPDRSDLDHFGLGRFAIGQMAIVHYLSGCR